MTWRGCAAARRPIAAVEITRLPARRRRHNEYPGRVWIWICLGVAFALTLAAWAVPFVREFGQ